MNEERRKKRGRKKMAARERRKRGRRKRKVKERVRNKGKE